MSLPDSSLPVVFVQPGESHFVRQPTILRTLLGSCVGISFRVPRLQVGVLCHPQLPRVPSRSATQLSRSVGRRYVDFAIREIARQLDRLGAKRTEVEVKLFGGGDVLLPSANSRRPTVGQLNSEVAARVLEEEGFSIAASSLGGSRGVNIHFNTETGEVLLQRHAQIISTFVSASPRVHSTEIQSGEQTLRILE